jgi:CheY-specific phosphatase CheX
MQQLVEDLGESACRDLFDAYGVALERCVGVESNKELTLTGVIGFTGPGICGTCVLASTSSPIQASMPEGGSIRDWVAELSNQLAGRLKTKLIAVGVTVYITTPVVLRGTRMEPLPAVDIAPRTFTTADGSLLLWVEVETGPDFEISPSPGPVVSEGEAILF